MVSAMAEPANQRDDSSKPEPEEEAPQPTPFDHPLFLPIILLGLSVWFGYDGWINTDEHMAEHRTFNQIGFVALVLAGSWYSYKAWLELKAKRDDGSGSSDGGPPPVA